MSENRCASCNRKQAQITCGICGTNICKSCTEFIELDHFSYLAEVPKYLTHGSYCQTCFSSQVLPQLDSYNGLLEKARDIEVFYKAQSKETRLIKRDELPVSVTDCADYDQAILRLAFRAAEIGCNAIIDVDLKSKKLRSGSYQHTLWTGTAIPAHVHQDELVKDRSIWDNPN